MVVVCVIDVLCVIVCHSRLVWVMMHVYLLAYVCHDV